MKTPAQSPSVVSAFADLDRARAELTRCAEAVQIHRNALRRWSRQQGLRVPAARCRQWETDRAAWSARFTAEMEHRNALRAFRRCAMIAALERVVETDRRLTAA